MVVCVLPVLVWFVVVPPKLVVPLVVSDEVEEDDPLLVDDDVPVSVPLLLVVELDVPTPLAMPVDAV